jgi:hypothetical protein
MSQPGFQGNRYILDINATAGAWVNILAKSSVRRLVIDESQVTAAGVANVPQGAIDYRLPNDDTPNGFTTVFRAVASFEGIIGDAHLPIVLGSPLGTDGKDGVIIGQLGQPLLGIVGTLPATTMIQVRSASATATSLVVTEYN